MNWPLRHTARFLRVYFTYRSWFFAVEIFDWNMEKAIQAAVEVCLSPYFGQTDETKLKVQFCSFILIFCRQSTFVNH